MNMNLAVIGLTAILLTPAQIVAAAEKDKDPLAVVMLGAAGEWDFPGGDFSLGPSVAVEFGMIKDWLEIEIGGAKLFRRGTSEWESEVVFRKGGWRARAKEILLRAETMKDAHARQEMREVAASYQRLAQQANNCPGRETRRRPHRTAAARTDGLRSRTCDWRPGITRERVKGRSGTNTCPTDFLCPVTDTQQTIGRRLFFWGRYLCRVHFIEQNVVATWLRSVAASRHFAPQPKCEGIIRCCLSITARWLRLRSWAH